MSKFRELDRRLNYLLELERRVVGISFLRTRADFDIYEAPATKKLVPYCRAVQQATEGISM